MLFCYQATRNWGYKYKTDTISRDGIAGLS